MVNGGRMEAGLAGSGRKYLHHSAMILLVVINKEKHYVTQTIIKFFRESFIPK